MSAPAGGLPVTDAIGRSYASPLPYRVSREKVREFADALSDPHPAYRDPAVAAKLGHPDVVAPPTFAIVVTFGLLDQLRTDPELGLSLSRVVHADQKFVAARPICAGDELRAELTIARARPMGDADLIMTRTSVTTEDGAPVAEVAAAILHQRGADAASIADTADTAAADQRAAAELGAVGSDGEPSLVVPSSADLTVDAELSGVRQAVRRSDLVRYAGASGDFNPIHWSDRVAQRVGLPGVIAHGMLTMGLAGRVVTNWAGDPGRVVEFSTRFSEPVRVPDDDDGVRLDVRGSVGAILDDQRVRIDLDASAGGRSVLGRARAIVQL